MDNSDKVFAIALVADFPLFVLSDSCIIPCVINNSTKIKGVTTLKFHDNNSRTFVSHFIISDDR